MADQNSDFCVTSPSNWKMFQSPTGQRIVVPQHSQWIVLNKIHAHTMTSRWQGMHAANGWTVPVWTGGGINHTFPNLPKSVLLSKDFGTCTDEWVFFSGVYGVLRTDGYSPSSIQLPSFGPILSAVGGAAQGVCRTFAFWGIGVGADDYPPGGNDSLQICGHCVQESVVILASVLGTVLWRCKPFGREVFKLYEDPGFSSLANSCMDLSTRTSTSRLSSVNELQTLKC